MTRQFLKGVKVIIVFINCRYANEKSGKYILKCIPFIVIKTSFTHVIIIKFAQRVFSERYHLSCEKVSLMLKPLDECILQGCIVYISIIAFFYSLFDYTYVRTRQLARFCSLPELLSKGFLKC
ncbi:hypothetical protein C2G38_730299 [Gigaspora rosea]|uniref:Uncharacterized protein n=1 Tax=Gigaspora rosea TaxID=44941 RepID=A0A397W8T9_9GLOM|nr:hypothetical protein C2G38_730299 [Gigaspora rosea]